MIPEGNTAAELPRASREGNSTGKASAGGEFSGNFRVGPWQGEAQPAAANSYTLPLPLTPFQLLTQSPLLRRARIIRLAPPLRGATPRSKWPLRKNHLPQQAPSRKASRKHGSGDLDWADRSLGGFQLQPTENIRASRRPPAETGSSLGRRLAEWSQGGSGGSGSAAEGAEDFVQGHTAKQV